MNNIINTEYTSYFLLKQKVNNNYIDIAKYKNSFCNRIRLLFKKFDKSKELYIVPVFKGIEGYYYKFQ